MANFKVPYEFVAGTKAKAEEVNTNFSAIKEELNKKLDISNDGYITIKDAISDNQPITKSQFNISKEELKTEITKKIQNKELKKAFLFESGNTNSNIRPDLLDIEDNTKIVFKVDDINYKTLKGVLADSTDFERVSIPDLPVSNLSDGTYNLFVGKEGVCLPIANTIYRQKVEPVGIVESSWTQPVLTSNGSLGGNSFAVADDGHADLDISGDAWLLFNPTTGKLSSQPLCSWAGTKTPGGVTIYNPIPLKITNIQVTNHSWSNAALGAGYGITGGIIQASNDNSTWVNLKTFTNSVVALSETWNIDLSDNTNAYKYYRIWITSHSSSAYSGRNYIGSLTLTATQVVGTSLLNKVWLDTSVKPYISKKYNGTSWETFDYVPLPQNITVKNGAITEVNQIGNYNDNGWDNYVILPDTSRSTRLTKDTSYEAPMNGWLSNGTSLVKPLLLGQVFTPSQDGYTFYAMKGE